MSVLITGGLSFIGVNLAREFLNNDEPVILYDTHLRSSSILPETNGSERIKILRGDVTNFSHLLEIVDGERPDGIIHLVAMLAEADCRAYPTEGMRLSVIGTQNVLELMRLKRLRRFVYVSTGAVFGHRPNWAVSLKEDDHPSPTGMYPLFKYLAEELTRKYRSIYGLSTAVVRVAYVYGPDIITPSVTLTRGPIPYFLYMALTGQQIHQDSGGDFAANYSYVKDVARGIYLAYSCANLPHDTYHISSGGNYLTKDVVDAIRSVVPGCDLSIGPGEKPYSLQTPIRGPLSITLAEKELGYTVRYSLGEAIRDYADWMRQELDARGVRQSRSE